MSKKLAILGHENRSEEVIELLKMLGGSETFGLSCAKTDRERCGLFSAYF